MTTTYHLHVNELSVELLNSIKAAFKDKRIEITVSDEITNENQRTYADEDSFNFWMVKEEDIYQDYLSKPKK